MILRDDDIGFAVARVAVRELVRHPVHSFDGITELEPGDAGLRHERRNLLRHRADDCDVDVPDRDDRVFLEWRLRRALVVDVGAEVLKVSPL